MNKHDLAKSLSKSRGTWINADFLRAQLTASTALGASVVGHVVDKLKDEGFLKDGPESKAAGSATQGKACILAVRAGPIVNKMLGKLFDPLLNIIHHVSFRRPGILLIFSNAIAVQRSRQAYSQPLYVCSKDSRFAINAAAGATASCYSRSSQPCSNHDENKATSRSVIGCARNADSPSFRSTGFGQTHRSPDERGRRNSRCRGAAQGGKAL